MSIATLEDLQRLDVGTVVTGPQARQWSVIDGNRLTSDGFVLPMEEFQPMLDQLSVGEALEIGKTYQLSGGVFVHLLRRLVDDRWVYAQWQGEGRPSTPLPNIRATRASLLGSAAPAETPEWLQDIMPVVEEVAMWVAEHELQQARLARQAQSLNEQREREEEARSVRNEQIGKALKDYADEHLTEGADEWTALSDLCQRFDIPGPQPRTQEIEVRFSVDGTTEVEFDRSELEERIDGYGNVSVDSSYHTLSVEWSMSFTSEVEVDYGECACERIDAHEMVANYLRNENISYDDFEYEVECENC